MVKFQIMSDIHIEAFDTDLSIETFIKPCADILLLAGDIGRIHKYTQLEKFLIEICSKFEIVLYVLGNHEYYWVDSTCRKNMEEVLEDVEKIKNQIPNLYILNRKSVIIDDVCVVGCTLWSQATVDIPRFIVRIPGMNKYKYNSLFNEDLKYIKRVIRYCQDKNIKLLVATHHCPTFSIERQHKNDKYESMYCSNLDYLLTSEKVHTWVCGHIHTNFDFRTKDGTRLVSNQKGRVRDNVQSYSMSKIIEV